MRMDEVFLTWSMPYTHKITGWCRESRKWGDRGERSRRSSTDRGGSEIGGQNRRRKGERFSIACVCLCIYSNEKDEVDR